VNRKWGRYYEAAGEEPRATLREALERFGPGEDRLAVDLGCGTGRDTAELLRRGWRVLAIDAQAEAIERLLARDDLDLGALEVRAERFEDAVLPPAHLVNSSFALPFCEPVAFPAVWARVVDSLPAGGRFCGQLFGDRDGWSEQRDLTFLARDQALELLREFELERFEEIEEDGQTALGEPKRWHLFHVVARKR
jgi:tellurite methyltransferase